MKRIIGLDLGTTSIGWAVVDEAEHSGEQSNIIKLGVRVIPLSTDEQQNFEKGKAITTNADRTLKRGMRRNLQRYKLRRQHLIAQLMEAGIITDETPLTEVGNRTTFETYRLRAQAADEEIALSDFARVLLMLNKKRGYKSNRKAKNGDEGVLIDGMTVAKELYEQQQTPGQYCYSLLRQGKKHLPDFYRSDLVAELDKIWGVQQVYYPDILTTDFRQQLTGATKTTTSKVFLGKYGIYTADNKGSDKQLQLYELRVKALKEQLAKEELAFVIADINGKINGSSGYLGAISDRSKELYFHHRTVGQQLMLNLKERPNDSLKNKVFYRQDYLDEFERLWETQARHHSELTPELKKKIRDTIIFYQRSLRSQKGLISFCELENKQVEVVVDGKKKTLTTGCRVCPKSSPIFQEYRIWQRLNDLVVTDKNSRTSYPLEEDQKRELFDELTYKAKLSKTEILKLLFGNSKQLDLNFKEIDGNRTQAALMNIYHEIVQRSGHDVPKWENMRSADQVNVVKEIFDTLGFKTDYLYFDSSKRGADLDSEPLYRLWHLLYSYEDDKSNTGTDKLVQHITELTGMDTEYAKLLATITFEDDYGSLSTKALQNILPYMAAGHDYSEACMLAGYRHSKRSLTRDELDNKELKDHLSLLPRNSLRNPVVEKILNQMCHVVNLLIDTYGRPDAIRIELARELKKNALEREELTKSINSNTKEQERIKDILAKEFGIDNASRNDITRYRLYEELEPLGYKTLYSNTFIPRDLLFSKSFDIEHIIPQARLFDDSYSNKTLESRDVNIEKGSKTAYDYVLDKQGEKGKEEYLARITELFNKKKIGQAKYNKLKMRQADIPDDFIDRDLRNTQYIARKAQEMLGEVTRDVLATTGSITDRLREDWQLVNVMQELNWDKYEKLGLTETKTDHDGQEIKKIKDWSKRNDHRHHAMDALTIAFTKRSYIQYLNSLNARSTNVVIQNIEKNQLYRDHRGHLRFAPPLLLGLFRAEAENHQVDDENLLSAALKQFRADAKKHLEAILVSSKAKNKVTTRNTNSIKQKGQGKYKKIQLTPRGQLHDETIYGKMLVPCTTEMAVGGKMDEETIARVCSPIYRKALLDRLKNNDYNPKKAFTGKNALEKKPIYLDLMHTRKVPLKVRVASMETQYTIRKPITPDLKIEKVVDAAVRRILQQRLGEYGGDAKKAFSNLDEEPIWLNRDKGIAIKRVTIFTGLTAPQPLHEKHDQYGRPLLDADGNKQPADFVAQGNNHHVAIYRDAKGELQESIVSFFEATTRSMLGIPIVDHDYNSNQGWQFLFTLKRNEYFVFPNTGFDPTTIDLTDPDNYALISPNLYRVQKLSSKYYVFRHHLDTTVEDNNALRDITWKRIQNLKSLEGIVKVRIDHIGRIVAVGEYK